MPPQRVVFRKPFAADSGFRDSHYYSAICHIKGIIVGNISEYLAFNLILLSDLNCVDSKVQNHEPMACKEQANEENNKSAS